MATFPSFSLLDYLEKNAPVICDGAKPLLLQSLGFPETKACFMANLTHPHLVPQVHEAYLKAGASILRANTEGAHRLALETLNLEERGENINNNGMALLREGAPVRGLLAGSVVSIKQDITGTIPDHLLETAYGEQLVYQSDTGAKLFIFSDFKEPEELKMAVQVAKRSVQKQVVAHVQWSANQTPSDLLQTLETLQKYADFIGIQAPAEQSNLPELVASMIEHFGVVSVLLDEPIPLPFGEVSTGFSESIPALLAYQPAIIGGGNHTTPAHIQTIAEHLKTLYE